MVKDVAKNSSYIATQTSEVDAPVASIAGTQKPKGSKASNNNTLSKKRPDDGTPENVPASTSRSYADVSNDRSVPKQQEDGGTFHTVGPNQGKRPNKGSSKRQFKKASVGGSGANSDVLVAGPSTFMIQLTNVSPTISTDDITKFIEKKDSNVKANEIRDHSTEGWNTKRFLLTFDYSCIDQVLSDDFWPSRIYFRRWFPSKVKAQGIGGQNN